MHRSCRFPTPAVPQLVPAALRRGLPCALLLLASRLPAQDWVRANFESLPVEPTSAARTPAAAAGGLHDAGPGLNSAKARAGRTANFGPLALSLSADGALEYNDNVRVEPSGRDGLIASAGLRVDASYQLTRLQELSLQGQVSERQPLTGPARRQSLFSVAPDSALRANVWLRSLRLSPFVKYRRQLDPVLSPVVSRTEILDQTAFTAGLQADLPLHEAGVQFLLLRERRSQQGDAALSLTSWSEVGALRLVRQLSRTNTLLADATFAASRSEGGPAGHADTLSVGLFDDWRLSPFLLVRVGTGIARNRYRELQVAGDASRNASPFHSVAFEHKVRENLAYAVEYRRSIQEGVSTNYYRLHQLSLTPRYRFTDSMSVESSVGWQRVHESGPLGEAATRWTCSLALGKQFNADLAGRLSWDHVNKSSTLRERDYAQNRVMLSFNQQF